MPSDKVQLLFQSYQVGTLCIPGQVCLLSRYSLVLTYVVRLEIEQEEQLYPFRARGETESQTRGSLGKPLVSI